jgi:hypothetical protein
MAPLRDTGWFKSSRSAAANEACVEVRLIDRWVGVRDSKNPAGPSFVVSNTAWSTFVHGGLTCGESLP